MALRRSRRLAGLSPEVLDEVNVQKEVSTAGFVGTLVSLVVLTGTVVFMTYWK